MRDPFLLCTFRKHVKTGLPHACLDWITSLLSTTYPYLASFNQKKKKKIMHEFQDVPSSTVEEHKLDK
jgi:hypothetical protein